MQITFDTATLADGDLNALMALIASLGGRLETAPVEKALATPRSDMLEAVSRRPASEQLMAQAAANRVAPAPPADDEDGEDGDQPGGDPTELDPDGIPWDARIHAKTKTKNGDGRWKKLRKGDEVLFGQVFAELQEKYRAEGNLPTGTNQTGTAAPAGDTASTGVAPPPPETEQPADTASQTEGKAPPPPAGNALTAPAPANAADASGVVSFSGYPDFVGKISAIRTPAIPYLVLNEIAETVGVSGGFLKMKDHEAVWPLFYDAASNLPA